MHLPFKETMFTSGWSTHLQYRWSPNVFLGVYTVWVRMLSHNDTISQVSCTVSPRTFKYHYVILVADKDPQFKVEHNIKKNTSHYLIMKLNE